MLITPARRSIKVHDALVHTLLGSHKHYGDIVRRSKSQLAPIVDRAPRCLHINKCIRFNVLLCAAFLRAAFRSVWLRACMSVCEAEQYTSHDDSQATCVRSDDILRFTAPSARLAAARFLRLGSASTDSQSTYQSLF
ncbi:hypothetical protein EVAR_3805_1 [Eumeta japonica]|uniref:Uncharacterized protein n=1 Tax=Eumeta variegata TaxID=151549 RepID=A0A4C1SS15_EUMVA|nr:hypothetical protein EVAR_3805_1 [Eumeta japonica]